MAPNPDHDCQQHSEGKLPETPPPEYDTIEHPQNVLKEPPYECAAASAAAMLQFNLDEANGVPLFISPFPVESKIPIEPGDLANVDKVKEVDHWALPELQDNSTKWADLSCSGKLKRVIVDYFGKLVCLIGLLYLFICSLSFLGSAFRLLGGKAAGEAFASNEVLSNPVCGLMIGVLATVLVQSSSTTTSIVVSMVAAEILYVRQAIPIVMGANIGTSVTNTLVAMFQAHDRNEFRRAFAGATVHDVFNWLSVICLLPLEITTGYLYKLSGVIVRSMNLESNEDAKVELIKIITKPFTSKIIEVDKKVITKIAIGDSSAIDDSMIKHWCETTEVTRLINVTMETNVTSEMSIPNASSETMNVTTLQNITSLVEVTDKIPLTKCSHLFVDTELSDTIVGIILLAGALAMLCICLVLIVKLLHSLLRGQIAIVIKRTINADFPGKLSWLTGYIAILVGAGLTLLVQSSSIFTSALTPLIGIGVVSLDRAYPLTLGANIGTTGTGLLAAMASSDGKLASALQIAFCHLLFNISGILIWYPIPCMRKVPIRVAKIFGNTTAKYRWFAGLYLVLMFFLLPGLVFALSVAGWQYLVAFGVPILTIATLAILISVLQVKAPKCLPHFLRTWDFLPKWMHSLEPFDRVVNRMFSCCRKCPCCKKSRKSNSYDVSHISQIPLQDCNTTLDSIKITSV